MGKHVVVVFGLIAALTLAGCGGDDGGPPGAPGQDGAPGEDGENCWDLNGNGVADAATEDTNHDGSVDVLDCRGQDGTDGEDGEDGEDSEDGENCWDLNGNGVADAATEDTNGDGSVDVLDCRGQDGTDGEDGEDGEDGGNVQITNFHGTYLLLSSGQFAEAGKYFAKATITSATADVAGTVSVTFTVADPSGKPVTGITGASFNIAKLVPPSGTESFNKWVPYIYRTQTVTGSAIGDWPNPDGITAYQGFRENDGILTDYRDGSYSYVFKTNLSNVVVDSTPITYDRGLTHRVSLMMGGGSGATADAFFDFVPDGSAVAETRDIVQTTACKNCHGGEFRGHGGDRLSVTTCVTCHVPGNIDPHGGETVDFKVMIHKIHAGGELVSIPGPDGIVWDDPSTALDESADNGEYAIWGFRNNKNEWWKVGFPAVIENCAKCHQGSGVDGDNWKNVPSRDACGSCHDDVDFATGTDHAGGSQTSDLNCTLCHAASGSGGIAASVTEAHDWTTKDPRDVPEFTADLTVSTPANGTHFVAGESPVVTLVLKENGAPIDHTTVMEDPTAEGCWAVYPPADFEQPCDPRDGLFRNASVFVHGPRARRAPVLTTTARAQVLSATTGPFDISASGATLVVKVDQGKDLLRYDSSGGDYVVPATITVPVSSGTFASTAAATTDEIVAWLNANSAFKARAIAYNQGGKVGIRSRNLGMVFALQLQASIGATQVFGGDLTVHMPIGFTPTNNVAQRTNAANNDPKAIRDTGDITYMLDPVDDLEPGTYIVDIEFADRGRVNPSPSTAPAVNYVAPTVARVTFQVKTPDEELPPANNCDSCHQANGNGLIVDVSRHNKKLDHTALDLCGNCHDYMPQNPTGTGWSGARPIGKRVHGIHFGSSLHYPLLTVDYVNGDPVKGRNWDITFPQDVRNCDTTCHLDGETSGTWAFKAARLPCGGCHDSDAVRAHMRTMTWDLTPADPWSGDEEEACEACH